MGGLSEGLARTIDPVLACLALGPEWRNWQTRGTQNPVRLTPRGGSTPPSGTILQQVRRSVRLAHRASEPKLCSNCARSRFGRDLKSLIAAIHRMRFGHNGRGLIPRPFVPRATVPDCGDSGRVLGVFLAMRVAERVTS